MKVRTCLVVLFIGISSQLCCESVICSIPSMISGNLCIVTGRVLAYEQITYQQEYEGTAGSSMTKTVATVEVVRTHYSATAVKTVYLIGSANFPSGTIISFYGYNYQAVPNDERKFITIGACNPVMEGHVWEKERFNFMEQRIQQSKIRSEIKRVQNDSLLGEYERNRLLRNCYDQFEEIYTPATKGGLSELFQAHLLLLDIMNAKRKRERLRLYRELIWSGYIARESWFDYLSIPKGMKDDLILEWKQIQQAWPLP